MERLCLDCDNPIKGRADKKFCDDQCRSNYNNRLKSEQSPFVKRINQILARNRRILEKLNPDGKTKTSLKKLSEEGFNFGYHTHIYQTQNNNNYIFCYEYGYLKLDQDIVLLVKKE